MLCLFVVHTLLVRVGVFGMLVDHMVVRLCCVAFCIIPAGLRAIIDAPLRHGSRFCSRHKLGCCGQACLFVLRSKLCLWRSDCNMLDRHFGN